MDPPRLYLVTDRNGTRGRSLNDAIEAALRGGVDGVQLREKDLPAREMFELAKDLRALCTRYRARLLINDRIDIALAVNADGVHLPVDSFSAADTRRLLGSGKLIGASTHNLAEATATEAAGADFIVFGPIFDTPSKRVYGAPVGLDLLAEVRSRVRIPVLAIGGVTPDRIHEICERGAAGVAVVSGILAADDPEGTARAYLGRLQG